MTHTRATTQIKREVVIWILLFVTSFVVGTIVHNANESLYPKQEVTKNYEVSSEVSINFMEMLWALWYANRWSLVIFTMLCIVRLFILFHIRRQEEVHQT